MRHSITQGEIRRIKRVCRKILGNLSNNAKIYVVEEIESLRELPHCDAVIKIRTCIILLEITGRVTPSDDLKKLRTTLSHLNRVVLDFTPHRFKIFPMIHMEKISSMDARIIRNSKIKGKPIMLIKCYEKIKEELLYHHI